MRMALEWLLPSHEAAAICTDSQSLLPINPERLQDISDLRRMLDQRASKTTLLRIPGHNRTADNEGTDACAKPAAAITRGSNPTSLLRPSQRTYPLKTNEPATFSLQNKRGIYIPRRFRGRPNVRPPPRGATPFCSPAYELVTPSPQDLHQLIRHECRT